MEENKRDCWHIILHYFNKGINATEMQKKKEKKICTIYGEGAVADQMCQSGL